MDSLEGYVSDDNRAIPFLNDLGWNVETIPWKTANTKYAQYDLVVIRTTWDYYEHPARFLATLDSIEKETTLANACALVRWNLEKTYLQDLDAAGVPVVPTRWSDVLTLATLQQGFSLFGRKPLVVKPVIGANAFNTFVVEDPLDTGPLNTFKGRPCMIQPFIPAVIEEGEYSLFYFASSFSHAILKKPKKGDFRVQEEHGGQITAIQPEKRLLKAAEKVMLTLPGNPLYARIDLVRDGKNNFVVMEVELIEPSMYLRMDPAAPERFAIAINNWAG